MFDSLSLLSLLSLSLCKSASPCKEGFSRGGCRASGSFGAKQEQILKLASPRNPNAPAILGGHRRSRLLGVVVGGGGQKRALSGSIACLGTFHDFTRCYRVSRFRN